MSAHAAIKVERLGKRYQLGARQPGYQTFREALAGSFGRLNPFAKADGARGEELWALRDVSFAVEVGEVVGIIGRNGAGKSTLLKVLSRITEPTTGRVEIYGRVGSLLEVGTGFHPELTGRENIYLNGSILGMRRREIARHFDEIVSFAEVEPFIDTPVKRYSSGMYLRLAFAVAAHLEPEILVVDEVLAVGDAAFQKKCLGKMGDVARQGRTVLFVSHNMTAVRSLCERVVWLEQGAVAEVGEADQVVVSYLQKGTFSVVEQEWPDPATAPGNEKVRVRSARVVPLDPDAGNRITVETPLRVEFEFWNHLPGALLNFTIHVFTIEGTYVFAQGSEAEPRPAGLIRVAAKIPANFLNDGIYTLTIQVVQDQSATAYQHADILVFEVHDAARTGGWFGKWPGVIRPKLEWASQHIAEKGVAHEAR